MSRCRHMPNPVSTRALDMPEGGVPRKGGLAEEAGSRARPLFILNSPLISRALRGWPRQSQRIAALRMATLLFDLGIDGRMDDG